PAQRTLEVSYVRSHAVADRVPDANRVRHEEQCPEQVPGEERAEWKANRSCQRPGQKAQAPHEARRANSKKPIATDPPLGGQQVPWLEQPTGIALDGSTPVPTCKPVAQVVANDSAEDSNDENGQQLQPPRPDQIAGERQNGLFGDG